jgi:hypothetical protein
MNQLTTTALLTLTSLHVHAQYSTNNESKAFGYAANVGWLNFRPTAADGVQVFEFSLSGKVHGANIGWINLGNGTANQYANSTSTSTDYGINHDGAGKLFGYAWGANIGWINLGTFRLKTDLVQRPDTDGGRAIGENAAADDLRSLRRENTLLRQENDI